MGDPEGETEKHTSQGAEVGYKEGTECGHHSRGFAFKYPM